MIRNSSVVLKEGEIIPLRAEVNYKNGLKDFDLTWSILDTSLASINKDTGELKAIKEGLVDVIASSSKDKNIFSKIQVKIIKANISSISTAPSNSLAISSPTPTSTPVIIPNQTTLNLVSITGKIYDDSKNPLDGVKVTAKYTVNSLPIVKTTNSVDGSYSISGIPIGVNIEITAEGKSGYVTRTRKEIVKAEFNLNNYDFGYNDSIIGTDLTGLYTIQNEPEITSLKINGILATDSDSENTINPTPRTPDTISLPNLTGIVQNNTSPYIIFDFTFSEPIDKDSFSINLISTSNFDSKLKRDPINLFYYFISDIQWGSDSKSLSIKVKTPLTINSISSEAKYMLSFKSPFKDLAKNSSKINKYFNFGNLKFNDFHTFSVKNNSDKLILTSSFLENNRVFRVPNFPSFVYDVLNFSFSKNIVDLLSSKYPDPVNTTYENPEKPFFGKINTLFRYDTNNPSKNNATILGDFSSGNFNVKYVIGRIKANDIANKNIILSPLGLPDLAPSSQRPTDYLDLITEVTFLNTIFLDLNEKYSDKGDIIVVSLGKNISGVYNDINNGISNVSITPDLGNFNFIDLTNLSRYGLNKSGIANFSSLSDTSGVLISNSGSGMLNNVSISDSQISLLVK